MRREATTEAIRGQLESVRVLRADTGWGKAEVRVGGGAGHVVALTGVVRGFDPGSTIEARGRWDEHPQYGKQFRALTIEVVIPQDAGGAIAWLASSLPGLGRKRAAECVERFGMPPELWRVIEQEPQRLTEIRGITSEGAQRIHDAHERVKGDREDAVLLRGWGLTDWQIKAVRETWKEKAVAELRRDPYQLSEHVRGFGFARADEVAQRMGTPKDDPSRIRAALCHLLEQAEGEGHCFVPGGKLVAFAVRLLGDAVNESAAARELAKLEEGGSAAGGASDAPPRVERDGTRCYRPATRAAEVEVVEVIESLLAWSSAAAVVEEHEEGERGAA